MDTPFSDASDEALVEAIRAGHEEAFPVLVHRYSGRIYAIGVSMLRNEQDARDVVQETFLNVHRKLDGFRGDSSFKTWICRIATNNALMKLRRRRRKPETSLLVKEISGSGEESRERDVVDLRPLADKVHEDRELGTQIREAVAGLPEKYREVLILADYQHMSMKEIAETLDLTVPNVKTRLHRARLQVRDALREYLAGRH
ncbi:MAG: sigma-70 family RNA polymerase sigma factor [Deltaproteobacteria bacterium]|nr:MAG: sigma-70 family RNA polymerase sigma factor [Deltaproteobacteria bacterium]